MDEMAVVSLQHPLQYPIHPTTATSSEPGQPWACQMYNLVQSSYIFGCIWNKTILIILCNHSHPISKNLYTQGIVWPHFLGLPSQLWPLCHCVLSVGPALIGMWDLQLGLIPLSCHHNFGQRQNSLNSYNYPFFLLPTQQLQDQNVNFLPNIYPTFRGHCNHIINVNLGCTLVADSPGCRDPSAALLFYLPSGLVTPLYLAAQLCLSSCNVDSLLACISQLTTGCLWGRHGCSWTERGNALPFASCILQIIVFLQHSQKEQQDLKDLIWCNKGQVRVL